jgi:cyclic pyranopterin phosphate synthase
MSEHMTFLPRRDLLSLEELDRICSAFVARGVTKLRITGGEPLVRKNIMWLIERLARLRDGGGLEELTLTTNGSQLERFAGALKDAGVARINVSLDTLRPDRFRAITRWGDLARVQAGLRAAEGAGLKVKINMVALKGTNEDEIDDMIRFAHGRGYDLTLIETMPMGEVEDDRTDQYLPLSIVRARLMDRWTLRDIPHRTGGPARYVEIAETGGRLGFITPLTHNFCESCNRVRLTCTGTLYMCLGQEDCVDLRAPLRSSDDDGPLNAAIDRAMILKPKGHDFVIDRRAGKPAVARHMSVTGG